MTLTLLLQLTYEEQLFASEITPVVKPSEQVQEPAPEQAPAQKEDSSAPWPEQEVPHC